MSKSYDSLFTLVMEADDDIPDFNPGDMGDIPAGNDPDMAAPPADTGSGNDDMPPEMADEGGDEFNFNMGDEGEGGAENETADEGDTNDEDNAENEKMGEKTNDILNERLYRKLTERNAEIENTVEQISKVLVALPYETTKEIDKPLNQLKTALAKGQQYAIDNFIHAEYGENLLFYEKLNSLYILLEDEIDKILKKASKGMDKK